MNNSKASRYGRKQRRKRANYRRPLGMERLEDRFVLSLVAAYGFNEGTGATLGDSSVNSLNGTISGAAWNASGKYGGALSFDGVNDWVTVNDNNLLDLTTGLTMEAWVFPTATSGTRDVLIKEGSGVDIYNLYARIDSGVPQSNVFVNGSNRSAEGAPLPLNTWSHLAGTYDGATLRLFVNGVQVASSSIAGSIATSNGPLRIGGNSLWGEFFAGRIDELRIYNHALNQSEIQADMNTPVGGLPPQDVTSPTVVAVTPLMGATAVNPSVNLTVTFSEAMNATTINSSTIELRDPAGLIVPATVSYNATNFTATIDPTSNLSTAAGYFTVQVKSGASGVKDLAGNPLATDFSWAFSTVALQLQEQTVFSGLTNPTVIKFAPDGRVFVAEKSGLVKVFDSLNDPSATVFADLRTQVHNYWDRGLLGMTLHPDFANNPYIYVLYTYDAPLGGTAPAWGSPGGTDDPGPPNGTGSQVSGRLSRLSVLPNGTWDGNELVLVADWANQYPSHSIGTVAFGADGYLYASGGDGASFGFADSGQTAGNLTPPIDDPVNEGGATRSQDLRTPNDPTGLHGSVIRIDPKTGLAVPFASTLVVQGSPTVDANGVLHYSVVSAYQGDQATTLRILEPDNPAPGEPRRFLYLLPVDPGVTDLNSQYGDGLEHARILNLHNLYNAVLVAPSFHIEPWYGDHATDPDIRLESFIIKDVVPFVDQMAAAGTTPERWVVGFSKSGSGALSLILRNPTVFSAAAAWDAPAQLTDMSTSSEMAINFGTEANFDNYEIPTLVDQNSGTFLNRNRIWISGDNSAWTAHMQTLHQQLLTEGILHTWAEGATRAHHWNSGWLEGAIAALDASSNSIPRHDENARRIVSYGFRNPFRFTFRPGTNEVFVGDVGWTAWEEINHISDLYGNVENFGWPAYEGPGPQVNYDGLNVPILENLYAAGPDAHVDPYYAYHHTQQVVVGSGEPTGSSAIAGLAFSQGGNLPGGFDGALLWTDFNRDTIWVMYRGVDGLPNPNNRALFYRSTTDAINAVNLEIGPGGMVYFPDFESGTIRRIRYTGNNQPPSAVINASEVAIQPGQTVNFDGTASTDPEGLPLSYAWDLDGDGDFDDSTSAQTSFLYAVAGVYTVGLRVTDQGDLADIETIQIIVGNRPTAVIDTPVLGSLFQANATLNFSGHATDTEDGSLSPSALTWTFSYYQAAEEDPTNINLRNRQVFTGVASGQYALPDWEFPVFLVIDLTATDSTGLQHTQSFQINPQTVILSFDTDPDGLQLSLNGRTKVGPFTRELVVGSVNQIGVPSPQSLGGQTYDFSAWSDGGAAVHFITAPATPATYNATFTLDTPQTPAGLVAAYSFNEGTGGTLGDSSVNSLNGTISGAAWTASGKYGGALSFDGSNDWVTVNDNNLLDLTTGLTMEAWVFPTATSGTRDVLIKEGSGVDIYNLYARIDSGVPQSNVFVNGSNRSAEGAPLPLNTWSHLAGTYDGATLRLFVNGVQVASSSIAGSIATSNGPLRIGGNSLWGEFFAGRIDELRIYDRALSAAEITIDMNTPVGNLTPSLSITDTTIQEGNGGTTNAIFTVTLSAAAAQTLTVQYATSNATAQSPDDYLATSGTLTFPSGTTSQTFTVPIVGDTAIEPNETFVVNLSNATNAAIADGQGIGTIVNDDAALSITDTTIQEGNGGTTNAIFTVTLSAPAAQTVTVQYATANATAQAPADYLVTSGTLTFPAGSTSQTITVPIVGDSQTEPNETFTVNLSNAINAAISDGQAIGTIVNDDGSTSLVAAYSFNEGTGGTLGDSSGNSLNGTISGAAWTASGKYGGALSFDGSNDWVTVNDNNLLDLTTGLTMEAWVFPTATSGTRDVLIKEGSGVDIYNLYARIDSGVPQSNVFVNGSNRSAEGAPLPLNTWSHLAGTYDGATLRLFVNGVQVASSSIAGSIATSNGPLRIGGNSLWGEFFAGRIDELRIYDRALSAAEITIDMNTPVGSPLQLIGDVADGTELEGMTLAQVLPLFNEAVARWQDLWSDKADIRRLNDLTIQITDLPEIMLGLASAATIWIDVNAAGRGWYVDPSPWDDSEFGRTDHTAVNRVDLLTVLTHELGHILGLDDEYTTDTHTDNVMSWSLPLGVRRNVLAAPVNAESVLVTQDPPLAKSLQFDIPTSALTDFIRQAKVRETAGSIFAVAGLSLEAPLESRTSTINDSVISRLTEVFEIEEPILLERRPKEWLDEFAEFDFSPFDEPVSDGLAALDSLFAELGSGPLDD